MSCLCKTYVSIAISGRARILYNFCLCNMYIILASSGRSTILYNSYMSCLCKINVPVASSGRGKILDMFCLCKMYVCLNVRLFKCTSVQMFKCKMYVWQFRPSSNSRHARCNVCNMHVSRPIASSCWVGSDRDIYHILDHNQFHIRELGSIET